MATEVDKAFDRLWSNKSLRLAVMRRMFARRSLDSNGCVKWTGAISGNGYGSIGAAGTTMRVHRLSWSFANGRSPKPGMDICHTCDVRDCFNPEHLFEGTRLENVLDMTRKGRGTYSFGEKNGANKLSQLDVVSIRIKLAMGLSQRRIANEYGVNRKTIFSISKNEFWKTATAPATNEDKSHG